MIYLVCFKSCFTLYIVYLCGVYMFLQPGITKVLCSLITKIIKEGAFSDTWKFVARHRANGSSHIKDVDFDKSYSQVAHADSFIINISITDMHIINAIILDVSNDLQNTNILIHEIVSVGPPPYYLEWFEKYYPNVTPNRDDVPFCIKLMNGI